MRKTSDSKPQAAMRLLLVDDNRNGLLARKLVLEEQGYVVTDCCTPEDALQEFITSAFDIVVTDYRMPHMNGVELIAELRKVKAEIPIVLISGLVDVLGLNEANTGANDVIPKGSTEVPHMIRAVNKLAQKQTPKKPASSQNAKRIRKASNS
ncbi:MAG: response regulator [Bryobacteraceae bacterium]|nr:response regulator [Bryobacteraceae bacterium]